MIELDPNSPSGLSKNGKPIGWKDNNGTYWRAKENGKKIRCHRRVWELTYGPIPEDKTVDHINRNGLDNRIENLRLADRRSQVRNRNAYGKVPYKWVKRRPNGRYQANWRHPYGPKVYVGTYNDPLEAHLAACADRLEQLWSL